MNDPRQEAFNEADRTMLQFMNWTKRTIVVSLLFLMIVMYGCNNGVETGPNATGSKYDGSVYDPKNLNGCKNFKCGD